ncbi:MAG: adenylosuccinate synthase [Thermoplasmatales archaeon B_DKE]|nr:MAG: adenylosuccinate synthase [Thermoplasmatales archaeon B_DKE]QRF75699.1 Adenylosuccinate synthetase [Thermoplasmatales archaeon]
MITIVVGLQFGDEGKGKITDYLSDQYDSVVRFNGGNNAGHTVVSELGKFKFHLLPSGSLRAGEVVLGNGMVIDPISLVDEIKMLKKSRPNLKILLSKKAHVVSEIHRYLDKAEESKRSSGNIGTTAKGIGPTYEDKYARTGIRVIDLLSRELLKQKIGIIYSMKQSLLEGSPFSGIVEREKVADQLYEAGKKLQEYFCDVQIVLNQHLEHGKSILFEGANGTLLDVDFGIYPFVTSSNTIAGSVWSGTGFPVRKVERIMGVVKAFTSKVGSGPFPTEISGKESDYLREKGQEFGTTTGRPRRMGWLDFPLLRYSIKLNDVDTLAITRLDTLGGIDKLRICESYRVNGKTVDEFDGSMDIGSVEPVYVDLKPWKTFGKEDALKYVKTGFESLPDEMYDYLRYIEEGTGKKIEVASIGENREMTIHRKM